MYFRFRRFLQLFIYLLIFIWISQACCPVCREPISNDADPLRDASQPIELQNAPDFRLTSDLKTLQVRMANLYMHQMQRGGIIDSNAEDSNVISIQNEDASEQVRRITCI